MSFSVDLVAWLAASAVNFIGGFVWFGPKTFFPVWWKAMGKGEDEKPGTENMGAVFGLTTLGVLVQTYVLAAVLGSLGVSGVAAGAAAGFTLAVGLAAFTSLSHRMFAGQGVKVWLIEVSSDVLNLTLAGAVIGLLASR